MPSGSTARRGAAVAQRSLTPLETALWIAQESDPADVSTHIHRAIWLGTRIDAEAAKYRLDQLARRQPVLRRSFQAAAAPAAVPPPQPPAPKNPRESRPGAPASAGSPLLPRKARDQAAPPRIASICLTQ